jgi:hypothetical protein
MGPTPIDHEFPPGDVVYRRVPRRYFDGRDLDDAVFNDKDGSGMSVDCGCCTTPDRTRSGSNAGNALGKPPEEFGVIWLRVEDIERTDALSVAHDPLPENPAHTVVRGEVESVETRLELSERCGWVVKPGDVLVLPFVLP